MLIAALLLADERLTTRKLVGVALGFAGVTVAIGIETLRTLDVRSVSQLAFLGAGLSYACAGVWARRRLRGVHPEVAACGMLTTSAALMIPAAFVLEGPLTLALSGQTVAALAYVSLMATGVAYFLYYRVIALAGSGNTMLTTLLVAPVAILAGAIVLGETLAPRAYAGFALVALGLAVLDGRLWALLRGRRGADAPADAPADGVSEKPLASAPPPG